MERAAAPWSLTGRGPPEINAVSATKNAPVKIRCASKYMTYETIIYRARVLSCPTRLDVWQCVGQLGMYAGDIARTLDLAPSTVSHHLAVLEDAGLVRHVRQGRYRWYESTGVRLGVVTEDEIVAPGG
jgi:Helix-turn-helix domain